MGISSIASQLSYAKGCSYRFSPICGLATEMSNDSNTLGDPDNSSICGDCNAPAHNMTSSLAFTCYSVPPKSRSIKHSDLLCLHQTMG